MRSTPGRRHFTCLRGCREFFLIPLATAAGQVLIVGTCTGARWREWAAAGCTSLLAIAAKLTVPPVAKRQRSSDRSFCLSVGGVPDFGPVSAQMQHSLGNEWPDPLQVASAVCGPPDFSPKSYCMTFRRRAADFWAEPWCRFLRYRLPPSAQRATSGRSTTITTITCNMPAAPVGIAGPRRRKPRRGTHAGLRRFPPGRVAAVTPPSTSK